MSVNRYLNIKPEDQSEITSESYLSDVVRQKFGVSIEYEHQRLFCDGWFHQIQTEIKCVGGCSGYYELFRAPYASGGRIYHYYALVCLKCKWANIKQDLPKHLQSELNKYKIDADKHTSESGSLDVEDEKDPKKVIESIPPVAAIDQYGIGAKLRSDETVYDESIRLAFKLKTLKGIFSDYEVEILEKYGNWFNRLTSGEQPKNLAQECFVKVARGKTKPGTIQEMAWWKYLNRLAWEFDDCNLSWEEYINGVETTVSNSKKELEEPHFSEQEDSHLSESPSDPNLIVSKILYGPGPIKIKQSEGISGSRDDWRKNRRRYDG